METVLVYDTLKHRDLQIMKNTTTSLNILIDKNLKFILKSSEQGQT